jgi:hypothetical protein
MLNTKNGQNKNNLKFFSIFEIRNLTSFFYSQLKSQKKKDIKIIQKVKSTHGEVIINIFKTLEIKGYSLVCYEIITNFENILGIF